MTLVGWKLFKDDRRVHFGFVLLRLRKDFHFTDYEISNITGIPMDYLNNFIRVVFPIVDSYILKNLSKLNEEEMLKEWDELPNGHGGRQGFYVVKEKKEWYDIKNEEKGKWKEPFFKLGGESEKEYEDKISRKA